MLVYLPNITLSLLFVLICSELSVKKFTPLPKTLQRLSIENKIKVKLFTIVCKTNTINPCLPSNNSPCPPISTTLVFLLLLKQIKSIPASEPFAELPGTGLSQIITHSFSFSGYYAQFHPLRDLFLNYPNEKSPLAIL